MLATKLTPPMRYGVAVVATVLALSLKRVLDPWVQESAVLEFGLIAVSFVAWFGNLGPALLTTVLTALGAELLFFASKRSLPIHWSTDMFRLGMFLIEGVLIGLLVEALHLARRRAEVACQARDRFLAVLSHELRTPLTPVLATVSAMLEEGSDHDHHTELQMIQRNIQTEARLIDDLLDVSQIAEGRMPLDLHVLDLHEILLRALEVCRLDIDAKGLNLTLELDARSHHARLDRVRMKQLFWNLIHNAVKFTHPGGCLTIRTRNEVPRGRKNAPTSLGLIVEFEDSGIGITPNWEERIFEPFEQACRDRSDKEERQRGLGLGLAISRSVAAAHGGRLIAISRGRDLGSTFRLELSAVPTPESWLDPDAPRAPRGGPAIESCRKILLVEDNPDTLRFLSLVLGRRGHEVIAASNLELAQTKLLDRSIDLLISDIELPDGTGLELMESLPAGRRLPAIALSGFGSEDDIRRSLEAGFAEHLTKPVTIGQLEAAISRVLNASIRDPALITGHA